MPDEFEKWLPNVRDLKPGLTRKCVYVLGLSERPSERLKKVREWHAASKEGPGAVLLLSINLATGLLLAGVDAPKKKKKKKNAADASAAAACATVADAEGADPLDAAAMLIDLSLPSPVLPKATAADLEKAEIGRLLREGADVMVVARSSCSPTPPARSDMCRSQDEAHEIKSKDSKRSRAVKTVLTHRRLALTGSPMQNNLLEFWAMARSLLLDWMGSDRTVLPTDGLREAGRHGLGKGASVSQSAQSLDC